MYGGGRLVKRVGIMHRRRNTNVTKKAAKKKTVKRSHKGHGKRSW